MFTTDNGDEHAKIVETAHNMPMSSFVCAAAEKGTDIHFTRSFFHHEVAGFTVRRNGIESRASIQTIGQGLDGESRYAIALIGSLDSLTDDQSDAVPSCLLNSQLDVDLASGMVAAFDGSVMGAILGSGGDFNQTIRSVCRAVASDLGEAREDR